MSNLNRNRTPAYPPSLSGKRNEELRCDVCRKSNNLESSRKLLRCGGCKKAWYCSKKCQKKAWGKHKLVCKRTNKNKTKNEHLLKDSPKFSRWNWIANSNQGVACRVASLLVRIELARVAGLSSSAQDIGRVLTNLRLVSRDWRNAVDSSIPWTASKRFHYKWWKDNPFVYSVLKARQLKVFQWCMENLNHIKQRNIGSVDLLSRVLESTSSKSIMADIGDFKNPRKELNHKSWYVSPTKLECIKAIHNNDVRQALGEPTIESMSQIEFLRSSQEFPRLIENLSELEIVKWVVKNWKLEKKDFLLQKKGVMSRKPMDLAKYLQQKFNFNRFEALGSDLSVLGSWCGDARNLKFVQWYVETYGITKAMFQGAGSTFAYETIKRAAEAGDRETLKWLSKRFKMTRTEMIKHVLPSVCQSLDEYLICWFHKLYKLKKQDILQAHSVGGSVLSVAVCQHNCDFLSFLINELRMKMEVEEMKAKRGWDWKRCNMRPHEDFCRKCQTQRGGSVIKRNSTDADDNADIFAGAMRSIFEKSVFEETAGIRRDG